MASRKDAPAPSLPDFHLGPWLVQPSLNVIGQGGVVRRLEPQVMDLLRFLATAGGRVVSKDEIIDAVWQGRFIADATLTRSIADLRRALGDDQSLHRYIETIPKRGYRLVAPLSAGGAGRQDAVAARPRESGRVADRLASTRRSRFVGRAAAIEMVQSALLADERPFVVFHLSGEWGAGKTALVGELARVAEELGRTIVAIDGRKHRTVADGVPRCAGPGGRRGARRRAGSHRTVARRRSVDRRHVRAPWAAGRLDAPDIPAAAAPAKPGGDRRTGTNRRRPGAPMRRGRRSRASIGSATCPSRRAVST